MSSSEIKKREKFLKKEETQKFIKDVLHQQEPLTKEQVEFLTKIVNYAQTVYNYSGEDTGITDEEFDILFEKLDMMEEMKISTEIVSNMKTGYHRYPSLRGTLDKIYYLSEDEKENAVNKSRRSLIDWIETSGRKIYEKTGKHVNLMEEEIYVFPKWDGVSCIFEFDKTGKLQRALTRGFTETNEAQIVTHIFEDIVTGPIKNALYDYGVKTEIMMTNEDLRTYNEIYGTNYKNSRSIVSSIMNSDEKDGRVKFLKIMQLRLSYMIDGEESLQELSPNALNTDFISCKLGDIETIRKFAEHHREVNGLRCDGAVIYIKNQKIQNLLGRENEKQKFEVAFKFTEVHDYSKVTGIRFQMGLFGSVNPILEVKPVILKGNTIQNISLGSMARFEELKLAEGDKVKVLYDIIPYVVFDNDDENCKRSGNRPFETPTTCPDCGEPLDVVTSATGNSYYCRNKKCPCIIKGRILNYITKMLIDGISYATVDQLYDEGYLKSISDLYKLEKHRKDLCKLEGFGKQSVKLILDEIENKKTVNEARFLSAIGIEGIGLKIFEKILGIITYDELMDLCFNYKGKAIKTLVEIPGIKEKTAIKIIDGIKDNEKLILELEEILDLVSFKKEKARFKACFTKIRPNDDLSDFITVKGGLATDTLTKDVDFLVIPMKGVTSSKTEKAQKWGIPVIALNECESYINENYPLFK